MVLIRVIDLDDASGVAFFLTKALCSASFQVRCPSFATQHSNKEFMND